MKCTLVSYCGPWPAEHLRTLESCYSRSPYFEYYREDVLSLIQKQEKYLLDKNMAILEWLNKILKLGGTVSLTDVYRKEYSPDVTDKRNHILPKNFQGQPQPFRYTQVFEDRTGFQPNLCILDLLFCYGPDIKNGLKDNKLTF
mgnify:CR=1 FL=1